MRIQPDGGGAVAATQRMAEISSTDDTMRGPIESIEVRPEVKEEDGGEDKSDEDADAPEDYAGGETPAVDNGQYKALKNIAEVLSNLKIKVKGDE